MLWSSSLIFNPIYFFQQQFIRGSDCDDNVEELNSHGSLQAFDSLCIHSAFL